MAMAMAMATPTPTKRAATALPLPLRLQPCLLLRLRPALPATLRILDLTANRLVAFPPLLLRLPQLTVLRVARQQLRALPSALSALVSLEEFDASYNSLGAALQLEAPGLPRLRRLLLNGNCLTTVR